MLAGKSESIDSLHNLFDKNLKLLNSGSRVSTDFFDIRYYAQAGTIHFFPIDKQAIDRLNRLVGRERAWLPDDDKQASKDFWKQYDCAEKVTKEMTISVSRWGRLEDNDEKLIAAHQTACDKLGIKTDNMLAN